MTVFHLHPPVGHGRELHAAGTVPSAIARRTDRRQGIRVVEGVVLTATGLGYQAQGIHLERVDGTPRRWAAGRPGQNREIASSTRLEGLARRLLAAGELVADADPGGDAA